ncbi:methyltransferase domain-containing protein [Peptostreptococcaceae bacterium OttesenSCG-928-C18]|nr:methyltransferase domain-containing protein [Peptostreptococcaceae bacterium OttesenSCG-928-C18]
MSNHNHNHHESSNKNFMTKIEFLDSEMRKRIISSEKILSMLQIQENSNILDVGAGSGYLTIPAAKKTTGTVFALDVDNRMLRVIEIKSKNEEISNIELIQGDAGHIPLANDSVDIVIASLILHEVDSISIVLKEISRVLKKGGYFLCLEYEKEESDVKGPPMHIRIPSACMEQAIDFAGFQMEQKIIGGESIYIIIAKNM